MAKAGPGNTDNVKVIVRCRPVGSHEEGPCIVKMDSDLNSISVDNPNGTEKQTPKTFYFDGVYDPGCSQMDVFAGSIQPMIDDVLKGYNGTIFAYGQTGSGKTYTMSGEADPPSKRGIIPNTMQYFFDTVADAEKDQEFLIQVSFLEIYNEEIRDLLTPNVERLPLREDAKGGVFVNGLTHHIVKSEEEVDAIMIRGNKARVTAATNMNKQSSRSHSIFTLRMEAREMIDGKETFRVGKLNLVDLAGSERQSKTGAEGQRLQEGITINLSLTSLGLVINKLVTRANEMAKPANKRKKNAEHIPYRDSKLTRLLQDSLGGNSKTVMIANIGPVKYNYDETMTTLRYADRAKQIKNKPKINEDPKDALLREMREQIALLQAQLSERGVGAPTAPLGDGDASMNAEVTKLSGMSDEERQVYLKNSTRSTKEVAELTAMLDEKAKAEAAQRARLEEMTSQLDRMKTQLVKGGESFQQRTMEHKKQLEVAKVNLDKKRKQEKHLRHQHQELARAMRSKLREREETFKETYNSLQEELDEKTAALERARAENDRLLAAIDERDEQLTESRAALDEAGEIAGQLRQENEELGEQQAQFLKELGLEAMISEYLLPGTMKDLVLSLAEWDDVEQAWYIANQQLAGNVLRPQHPHWNAATRRPTSEFTRQAHAVNPHNARYSVENALGPSEAEVVPASSQSLETTAQEPHQWSERPATSRTAVGRPGTARRSGRARAPEQDIPVGRGLGRAR